MASQRETYRLQGSRGRALPILAFGAACLVLPAAAVADTVYLKNGRTISATQVVVLEEEGRVILYQGPNRVEIPLAIVERIVEDERESELLEPSPVQPAAPEAETPPAEGAEGEEGAAGEEAEGEEVPPQETRAYWQDAVRAIEDERAELQDALEALRREERAFLFSHRSTAETKAKIEAVQTRLAELDVAMEELRREARRLQVPPGWLRLDPRAPGDVG